VSLPVLLVTSCFASISASDSPIEVGGMSFDDDGARDLPFSFKGADKVRGDRAWLDRGCECRHWSYEWRQLLKHGLAIPA